MRLTFFNTIVRSSFLKNTPQSTQIKWFSNQKLSNHDLISKAFGLDKIRAFPDLLNALKSNPDTLIFVPPFKLNKIIETVHQLRTINDLFKSHVKKQGIIFELLEERNTKKLVRSANDLFVLNPHTILFLEREHLCNLIHNKEILLKALQWCDEVPLTLLDKLGKDHVEAISGINKMSAPLANFMATHTRHSTKEIGIIVKFLNDPKYDEQAECESTLNYHQ